MENLPKERDFDQTIGSMRPEYKLMRQECVSKVDVIKELSIIFPGLFINLDYAYPHQWMQSIQSHSKAQYLDFVYIYDNINGDRRNGFGFPFPLSHLSRIVYESWLISINQDLFDIDKNGLWNIRQPKLMKYEKLVVQMIQDQQITSKEAIVMLDLIDSFSPSLEKDLKKRPYLTSAFESLFKRENDTDN